MKSRSDSESLMPPMCSPKWRPPPVACSGWDPCCAPRRSAWRPPWRFYPLAAAPPRTARSGSRRLSPRLRTGATRGCPTIKPRRRSGPANRQPTTAPRTGSVKPCASRSRGRDPRGRDRGRTAAEGPGLVGDAGAHVLRRTGRDPDGRRITISVALFEDTDGGCAFCAVSSRDAGGSVTYSRSFEWLLGTEDSRGAARLPHLSRSGARHPASYLGPWKTRTGSQARTVPQCRPYGLCAEHGLRAEQEPQGPRGQCRHVCGAGGLPAQHRWDLQGLRRPLLSPPARARFRRRGRSRRRSAPRPLTRRSLRPVRPQEKRPGAPSRARPPVLFRNCVNVKDFRKSVSETRPDLFRVDGRAFVAPRSGRFLRRSAVRLGPKQVEDLGLISRVRTLRGALSE